MISLWRFVQISQSHSPKIKKCSPEEPFIRNITWNQFLCFFLFGWFQHYVQRYSNILLRTVQFHLFWTICFIPLANGLVLSKSSSAFTRAYRCFLEKFFNELYETLHWKNMFRFRWYRLFFCIKRYLFNAELFQNILAKFCRWIYMLSISPSHSLTSHNHPFSKRIKIIIIDTDGFLCSTLSPYDSAIRNFIEKY